jgi:hypothetical protein
LGLGQFFPLFSPPQNDVGSSCIPNFEPFTPILVSLDNDKGKNVVDDATGKGQEKKKRKMHDKVRKFENAWTTRLPWVELVFDEQG